MAKKPQPNNQRRGIKEFFGKLAVSAKEFIRKFFVSLKRSPQSIALLVMTVSFLYYSFNLTSIANTTTKINSPNMGQCEFAGMLLSILSFVCFLRSFPKRQKVNKLMLGLLMFMLVVIVFVDSVYIMRITNALTRADSPITITKDTVYIWYAQNVMEWHIILTCVSILLIATLPLYSKLIRKINTSIEVEGNEDIEAIDISGEDE